MRRPHLDTSALSPACRASGRRGRHEASADLGLLVPSLRGESFHHALYESMGLAGKAVTAGRMLQRLGSAIRVELTAIESIERRG
jgi:hypothetical protein